MRALFASAAPLAAARAPEIAASKAFVDGFSNQGGSYVTSTSGSFEVPGGTGRALLVLVVYMARNAQVRAFSAPTFDGTALTEVLAPTSAGDKGSPGVAAYLLTSPATGSKTLSVAYNEDLVAVAVLAVALHYVDAASAVEETDSGSLEAASASGSLEPAAQRLVIGAAGLQGHDGLPVSATGGASLEASGATNTANVFNDLAYALARRTTSAGGPITPGVGFNVSDGLGHGWLVLKGVGDAASAPSEPATPPSGGAVGLRFRPPDPAATLDVVTVTPGTDQSVSGAKTDDLLVVLPSAPATTWWRLEATGYRGYYVIGGEMPLRALGSITAPDGATARGQNFWLSLRSHEDAVGAFVYLARLHLTNDPDVRSAAHSQYGDILNTGGDVNASIDNFDAWQDVWIDNVLVEGGLYGWGPDLVAHSDFWKAERGGYRTLNVHKVDIPWGYQGFYSLSYQTRQANGFFRPHPQAAAHYYDTVLRIIRTRGQGGAWWKDHPKAIYFSRGDSHVRAGEYVPTTFHEGGADGAGVWVAGSTHATENFHPKGGEWRPRLNAAGTEWTWSSVEPQPGRPFATGRVHRSETPPAVVTAADVGTAYRITSRAELEALIAAF